MAADPEWERLLFKFAAHALRDEPFREELVTHYRSLREAIAAALSDTLPLPPERVAVMAFAMCNGLALERSSSQMPCATTTTRRCSGRPQRGGRSRWDACRGR